MLQFKMRTRIVQICILLTIPFCNACSKAICQDTAAKDVASSPSPLKRYLDQFRAAQLRLSASLFVIRDGVEQFSEEETLSILIDQDSHRAKVITKPAGKSLARSPDKTAKEQVITPERYLYASSVPNTMSAIAVSGRLDSSAEARSDFIRLSYFSVLLGYLPVGGEYGKILDMVTLNKSKQVNFDGHPCKKYEGEGENIKYYVTLSPTHGYMPVKINYVTTKPGVSDIVSYDYEVKKISGSGEKSRPIEFEIKFSRADGPSATLDLLRRVKVDLMQPTRLSKSSFNITSQIPDDIPVNVYDSPELTYKWEDGEIVPDLDGKSIIVADAAFFSKPGRGSFFLYLLGFACIIFGAYVAWRQICKKKESKRPLMWR